MRMQYNLIAFMASYIDIARHTVNCRITAVLLMVSARAQSMQLKHLDAISSYLLDVSDHDAEDFVYARG